MRALWLAMLMVLGSSACFSQTPGLVISEYCANPAGTDSPFEYVELVATRSIDFSVTPYCVVWCNNGTATTNGWIAGAALSYGFAITSGTVAFGDVVYVGGTSMAPTGTKLRVIDTGTTAGDGFGNTNSGGVLGNGGANADGIAVFDTAIGTLTSSTVPIDAIFLGTGTGTAVVGGGAQGYQMPVNDRYSGGKLQSTSFLAPDPASGQVTIATGTLNVSSNVWTTVRVWGNSATGTSTSAVTLNSGGSAPAVVSSVRVGANPTAAASVLFTVTFSQSVTGVDSTDFSVSNAGTTVTAPSVTGVSGSGTSYTVTVNTGTGNGTLRLDVIDDDTILAGSTPLGGAGAGNGNFTTGEAYDVDKQSPSVSSITRTGSSPTSATSVGFLVTFSESVSNVDASDFSFTLVGVTGAAVTNISGTGATRTVTVGSYSGTGTIQLDLTDDDTILDAASNPLGGAGTGNGNFNTGEVYTITSGTTPPSIFFSEMFFNPPGTDAPNEYIEIRGTVSAVMPANIFLVAIEGDGPGTGLGDVQTIFDLSGRTLGSNGYLVFAQASNTYSFVSGSTVVTGTTTGFGGISGFSADSGTDIENQSVTFLLIQAATAPSLADDIDANDDGTPDGAVFAGWQIIDAVSVLDADAGDRSYTGASGITFTRNVAGPGTSVTVSWSAQWVGRSDGTSTGFAAADWAASDVLSGAAPNFALSTTSVEPTSFGGFSLNHIGGANFVPSVTVTAPAAAANWTASSSGNVVSWTTANINSGTVDIQISTTGPAGSFTNLATGLAFGLGTTSVTAPATLTSNAVIRVVHAAAQGDSGVFNIVSAPTVTVTAPTAGANWIESSTGNTVSWTTGGISSGTVDVQISTAGAGGPFSNLATGLAYNAGSTTVTAPATLTSNAVVRVVHASAQGDSAVFNIVAAPAPTISAVNPPLGSSAGGTSVTVTGTNFNAGTTVNFGATSASVTFVNSTTLTVSTPAGSGLVGVQVANGAQTAMLSNSYYFNSPLTLTAGDIWIIAVNTNAPDGFAFVTWVNIAANLEIAFTDDSFNSATAFVGAEQVVVWRAPAGGIAAGTVVTIFDNAGTPTPDVGTCPFGDLDSISASGDQVFAFQGDKVAANLLFGVNIANAGWVTSGASPNNSFLPTALSTAGRNFDLAAASGAATNTHGQYTGARTGQLTFGAYQTLIGTPPTNWTFATVNTALNSGDFALGAVNQAPVLTLPGGAVSYTAGDPATILDAGATFTDSDSANLDTGTLTIDFTANGSTDDRLEIRNQGTGAGQIGVSGANVSFGGTTIGTFGGGVGTTPLVVTFNASSSPAAAQALCRNITFRNVNAAPSTLARTVRFVALDGDGGTSVAVTKTVNVSLPAGTAPSITSTPSTTAIVGTLYSYTIITTGSPAPVISTNSLPTWLTLSGNVLSGTPSPTDAGTTPAITVTATNGVGSPATQNFMITVSTSGGGGSGNNDDEGGCSTGEKVSLVVMLSGLLSALAICMRRKRMLGSLQ